MHKCRSEWIEGEDRGIIAKVTLHDPPVGRRERKRRSTRAALAAAALDLFEERGFSATTIEDITERADVARRTFFRHFPNKEAALMPHPEDYEQFLVEALEQSELPLTMSAVIEAFAAAAEALQTDETAQRRRAAIIRENQLLLGSTTIEAIVTTRETVTNYIAQRCGVPPEDPNVHLVASFGLFALSVAYLRWTESAERTTLTTELHRTVAALQGLMVGEVTLGAPDHLDDGLAAH